MASYKTLLFCAPFSGQSVYYKGLLGASTGKNFGIAYEDENWYRNYIQTDGTISVLGAKRSGANLGANTVSIRKNSADTIVQVTTQNDGTVYEGGTETVSITAGDNCSIGHTLTSSFQWIRALFEPVADGHVSLYALMGYGNGFFVGSPIAFEHATLYHPFCGALRTNSASNEGTAKLKVKSAGVFRNIRVYIVKNIATSAVTLRSRKNGAYGNISISIPAGTTGAFTDYVNTDTLAIDDEYCFEVSDCGTNYVDFTSLTSEYHHSVANGEHDLYWGYPGYGTMLSPSASAVYVTPAGGWQTGSEAETYLTMGMDCGAKKFRMKVTTNTCNTDQVFVIRKNGSDTALTFTVGAGLTGEFIDNVNSITILANDQIAMKYTGGGTGNLTFEYFAMLIPASTGDAPTTGNSVQTYNRIWG